MVRSAPFHALTVPVSVGTATAFPIILADPFLDNTADFPETSVVFNEDVYITEAFPVQEKEALIRKSLALVHDSFGVPVKSSSVCHGVKVYG